MSFSLKWFTQKLAYPEDARTLMQSRVGEPAHQDDRTSGGGQLWQNVRTLSQDTPRGPVIHHPERTSAQLAA
jgi:hypothetical protein